MFAVAAVNVVSLGRPVRLGRRVNTGSRGRFVKVHSSGKKSGEIHEELKEKFTIAGERESEKTREPRAASHSWGSK